MRLLRWRGGTGRAAWFGAQLRLLTAEQMLAARREAEQLGLREDEQGLARNACLLSRAVYRCGRRCFPSGRAVLARLQPAQIEALAARYERLRREQSPSACDSPEQVAAWREALAGDEYERLKWRVLRALSVLPSERRAREMTDGDYLYCALQLELDDLEALDRLCPSCRQRAALGGCPVCGAPTEHESGTFDPARFEELKHHV